MDSLADIFGQDTRPPLGALFGVDDNRPPLGNIFNGPADFSDVTGGSSPTVDPGALARKRAQMAQARAHGDLGMVPTVDTSLPAVAKEGAASFLTGLGRQITDIPDLPGRMTSAFVDQIPGALPFAPGPQDPSEPPSPPPRFHLNTDIPGYSPFAADVRAADEAQQQRFTEAASGLPTYIAAGLDWAKRTATNTLDPLNWIGAEGGAQAVGARDVALEAAARQELPAALSQEVGQQTSRAAQDAALGLRATPAEGAELARLSLPIGEPAARPPLADLFAEPVDAAPQATAALERPAALPPPEPVAPAPIPEPVPTQALVPGPQIGGEARIEAATKLPPITADELAARGFEHPAPPERPPLADLFAEQPSGIPGENPDEFPLTGYRYQSRPGEAAGNPERGGVTYAASEDLAQKYARPMLGEGGPNLASKGLDFQNPYIIEGSSGVLNSPARELLAVEDPKFLRVLSSMGDDGHLAVLKKLGVPEDAAQKIVDLGGGYQMAMDRRAANIARSLGHDGIIMTDENGLPSEIVDLRANRTAPPSEPPAGLPDMAPPDPFNLPLSGRADAAAIDFITNNSQDSAARAAAALSPQERVALTDSLRAAHGDRIPVFRAGEIRPEVQSWTLDRAAAERMGHFDATGNYSGAGARPIVEGVARPEDVLFLGNATDREVALHSSRVETAPLTTGTKNAVTEAERAARGLPEVEALGRKTSGDNWLAAKAAFEADPQAARDLAARVAENPRPLSGAENDLLLHDRMKLTLDHRDALAAESQALAAGDTEGAAMAKIRRTSLESAMQTNDEAAKLSGTAWHESGMARQKLIAEDYSPLRLTNRAQVAAAEGGRELPEAVRQQLVETSQQLTDAQAKLASYEERVSQLEAQRAVGAVQRDVARAGRSGARRGSAAALDAEYADLSSRFRAVAGTPRAGLDPDLASLVAKMARNRVQRGAKGLAEVVDGIYQDIRPHVEGLEPRDVRDAISGYGNTAMHPARSDAVAELARIKQQGRLVSKIEDLGAGEGLPAGVARPKPTGDVAALQQKLKETMDTMGISRELSDPQRLAAMKTRLTNRERELTKQLAENYFPKNARRPLALDPDAIALQGQVEGLKNKADGIIRREELKNRSFPEKAMDATAGWGRFLKLTGTATLQKISAAASERALVFKPLEEFLKTTDRFTPIVKEFAAHAPIEGGASLKAIGKSYAGFFGKAAREEMMAGLRGEEGPFSQAMGQIHPEQGVPEWMQYPGRVHAGLKAPAKIAAYEYAMEKQAGHYLRRGNVDALRDPGVIAEMKGRAYEYANRDIFMGDNALSQAITTALRDKPGQSMTAKTMKTAGKVLMPIQKVPTNYAIEATHYLAGVPKAGLRMGNVMLAGAKATKGQADRTVADIVKAGLDHLAAEKGGMSAADQADQIIMNLTKGKLGAGLVGLGATGVITVGGYYHQGEHRGLNDLKPGEVQIGGKNTGIVLPHNLLHHPAIEALQVGGTIHRAKTLGEGLTDSAWGLGEQVPFLDEPLQAARETLHDRQGTKFLGQVARGMTLPPNAQSLARVLDQKEARTPGQMTAQELGFGGLQVNPLGIKVPEVAPVKRTPRGTFLEKMKKEEEAGIPGMRPYSGGPP
jgi:hypothetical protein